MPWARPTEPGFRIAYNPTMRVFSSVDFAVFDIPGFDERMAELARTVRPRLEAAGELLAPVLSEAVDRPIFAHVARHARRTVNPPDDTWVAFGADKRGYKKDVHFKVAISRHSVRLLFEAGPEYYDKAAWVREWTRQQRSIEKALSGIPNLAWFANEHDEDPKAMMADLSSKEVSALASGLTRRKDGQFVIGRRLGIRDRALANPRALTVAARETLVPLARLFVLNEARVKVAAS